jgi:hypothetical protein
MEKSIRELARTEGEVKCLCGEVSNDIGGVSSPKRDKALLPVCTSKGIANALVGGSETTLLDL